MATKVYFDELDAEKQVTVIDIVNQVLDGISSENEITHETEIDVNSLCAVLEKLNAEKKSAKEAAAAREKEEKEANKEAAAIAGLSYVKTLKVGDEITFWMGSGKNKKQYTLPIEKIGAKTVTVEFGGDVLTPTGDEGKRYIPFGKIVVPAAAADEAAEGNAEEAVA